MFQNSDTHYKNSSSFVKNFFHFVNDNADQKCQVFCNFFAPAGLSIWIHRIGLVFRINTTNEKHSTINNPILDP